MAMMDETPRQEHPLIPDVTIAHGSQEYAHMEVAKTDNDTKQLVETMKKCPELMALIFDQIHQHHPSEARNIQIHACLLAKITCTLWMLTSPFGCVKVITHEKQLKYPEVKEVKEAFKPNLVAFLGVQNDS